MAQKTRISRNRKNQLSAATAAPIEPLESRWLFSTYTVTTPGDSAGVVTSAGGGNFNATTLRAAITAANAHAGADTIDFAVVGTINLGSALPAVNDNLTIAGPGGSKLIVQRSASASTDFAIFQISTGKTAELSGLTIAKGVAALFGPGGIANDGTLTVANCTVSDNSTGIAEGGGGIGNSGMLTVINSTISGNSAGVGGGIENGGSLTLTNSVVSGNFANGDDGGGIANDGTLTIANSTISGNSAEEGNGGGIVNNGSLTATDSTFSGNVGEYGGGISNGPNTGDNVVLTNCTFAANSAEYDGGAIINGWDLTITNCTLSGNSVRFKSFSSDPGGGIYNSWKLTLDNSIVAGNLDPSAKPNDIAGTVTSGAYNVIGTGGSGGLVNGHNGNHVGVALSALKFTALTNNGGPTKTMAIWPGSIAMNAGSNALATAAKLYADQRGFPRISGGTVDAGAYEYQIAGGASIAGTVFNDLNHDGKHEANEPGLAGWQVYIDANNSGVYVPNDITTYTASNGSYKFTGLAPGTYIIREVRLDGWTRTEPAGNYPLGFYKLTLTANDAVMGKDFGNFL